MGDGDSFSFNDSEVITVIMNDCDNTNVQNSLGDPEISANDGVTNPEVSVTFDHIVGIHQQIKDDNAKMNYTDTNYNYYGALNDNSYADVSHYSKLQFDTDLSGCTIQYSKNLKHQYKRSNVELREFSMLCSLMFTKMFDDTDVMLNLATELGFSCAAEMIDFINRYDRRKV